jgi:hypothetical protein
MHSHLAIRHLIRQLDLHGRPEPACAIPDWLTSFLQEAASLFEPFSGSARAGYECQSTPEGWEASLFLGTNEIVGGADDGRVRAVNFRFDVRALMGRMQQIDSLVWSAFPERYADEDGDLSLLSIVGRVNGETVRLQVFACSPDEMSPAMRIHPDGRCEVIEEV